MAMCKKDSRSLHQKNRCFIPKKGVGLSLDVDLREKSENVY